VTTGQPITVPAADLADKTVLLVHPAWHSCGSYNVFAAQAEAYRALGANVHSLAVDGFPGNTAQSPAARAYFAATQDLKVGERFFTGMPFAAVPTRTFADAANAWLHGDYAAMLVEAARRSALPDALRTMSIDLIHCNHFFCMPVAARLRGDHNVPVLLDTHDLQARQFALRNRDAWTLAPKATYETMLARELIEMRAADRLIHLNTEEAETFRALLPEKSHVLLFPAVPPMPLSRGNDIVIVASANYPNFLGLNWFLSEVMPQVGNSPVRIVGNIDRLVRWHTPRLYRRYKSLFAGFTGDLAKVYANAGTILLPTTSGFGISIKTVEALSSGARLIATRPAFRGMGIEPAELNNVVLAETAADFASAIRQAVQAPALSEDACANSDTRRLYEKLFTPAAYRQRLAALGLAALAEPQFPHGLRATADATR
jgi:polysaccharide biosynthesis protein PslH